MSAQKTLDERAFPVRIRFIIPPNGFGTRMAEARVWLNEQVGRADHATHADNGALALYFRTPAPAMRFLEAFPDFALAG